MSHLAHEICGVDFFLSFNKVNPLVNDLIETFKKFLKNFQITYFSIDEIDFKEDYFSTLRVQCIRSKIFVYFIDRFALESNWFFYSFIYAKAHNQRYGTPLMLPIIIDNDINDSFLNQSLVDQLTNECSSVLRMRELRTFDNLIQKIKSATSSIINATFYDKPFIRQSDNFRPLNMKENDFIENIQKHEHEIIKEYKLNSNNMETILPKEKVFLAISVPHDQLNDHLLSMLHANCSLLWLDVTTFDKVNYFNFIWKKTETLNKTKFLKTPDTLIFYDMNTSQFMELYFKYSYKHKWNLELCDSYIKPSITHNINSKKYRSNTVKSTEIYYICQFKAKSNIYVNDTIGTNNDLDIHLNKLQASIFEKKFGNYYQEATKYNYKQLYGPCNIHPLLVNIDNDKNKHFYYTALYKPIDKETFFNIENNVNDTEIMNIFYEYNRINLKLIYLKAFKNENQIVKFMLIFTNTPFYEGTCQLFLGLNKNELSSKIISMREKSLYPTLITNYGITTGVNKEHLFAIFFCQI